MAYSGFELVTLWKLKLTVLYLLIVSFWFIKFEKNFNFVHEFFEWFCFGLTCVQKHN